MAAACSAGLRGRKRLAAEKMRGSRVVSPVEGAVWTGCDRTHQRAWSIWGCSRCGSYQQLSSRRAVAPAAAGEHFDDLDADVALAGGGQQGLGVAPVVGVEVEGGGEREHEGVEVESVEGLELDAGGEGAVAGDADVAGEALLAHFNEGFERAAGLGDLVEVVKVDDGVELEEVEGLDAEALLAGADVVPGVLA